MQFFTTFLHLYKSAFDCHELSCAALHSSQVDVHRFNLTLVLLHDQPQHLKFLSCNPDFLFRFVDKFNFPIPHLPALGLLQLLLQLTVPLHFVALLLSQQLLKHFNEDVAVMLFLIFLHFLFAQTLFKGVVELVGEGGEEVAVTVQFTFGELAFSAFVVLGGADLAAA